MFHFTRRAALLGDWSHSQVQAGSQTFFYFTIPWVNDSWSLSLSRFVKSVQGKIRYLQAVKLLFYFNSFSENHFSYHWEQPDEAPESTQGSSSCISPALPQNATTESAQNRFKYLEFFKSSKKMKERGKLFIMCKNAEIVPFFLYT